MVALKLLVVELVGVGPEFDASPDAPRWKEVEVGVGTEAGEEERGLRLVACASEASLTVRRSAGVCMVLFVRERESVCVSRSSRISEHIAPKDSECAELIFSLFGTL